MAENTSDVQHIQQNPDQEPKDPRIEKVITELSQAARQMKEPRLLSGSKTPEKNTPSIVYENADHTKRVELSWWNYHPEKQGGQFILPPKFKEYERLIPITLDSNWEDVQKRVATRVWIHLDKNNATVLQPLRNGKPLWHGESLDGTEEVVERPDFLPFILDAVLRHPNWRLTVEQLLDSRC
jgi:hypothetical protein